MISKTFQRKLDASPGKKLYYNLLIGLGYKNIKYVDLIDLFAAPYNFNLYEKK